MLWLRGTGPNWRGDQNLDQGHTLLTPAKEVGSYVTVTAAVNPPLTLALSDQFVFLIHFTLLGINNFVLFHKIDRGVEITQ